MYMEEFNVYKTSRRIFGVNATLIILEDITSNPVVNSKIKFIKFLHI